MPSRWAENKPLGTWVAYQREVRRKGTLAHKWECALVTLGFEWGPGGENRTGDVDARWRNRFQQLKAFRAAHGHCRVPQRWAENKALGIWVMHQRTARRKGTLAHKWVCALVSLGFDWSAR